MLILFLLMNFLILVCILTMLGFYIIDRKNIKNERLARLEEEVGEKMHKMISFSNQFSNVISGLNHELSPWLGSIKNINYTIRKKIKKNAPINEFLLHLEKVDSSCEQTISLLDTLSQNVKKLRKYSSSTSNVGDTILSWGKIHLLNKEIKNLITTDQIDINISSLNFNAYHSPMLLSQIISNLVQNSVDHNKENIEKLEINIFGDKNTNEIYIMDNGKGISKNNLDKIFQIGFSTKNENKSATGIGLATCLTYSELMDSHMFVESDGGKYTKFTIRFHNKGSDEYEIDNKSSTKLKKYNNSVDTYPNNSETKLLANNVVKQAFIKASKSQKIKSDKLKKWEN